jgi:hypothetical protein
MQTRDSRHELPSIRHMQQIVERIFEKIAIAGSQTFDESRTFRRSPHCSRVIDR